MITIKNLKLFFCTLLFSVYILSFHCIAADVTGAIQPDVAFTIITAASSLNSQKTYQLDAKEESRIIPVDISTKGAFFIQPSSMENIASIELYADANCSKLLNWFFYHPDPDHPEVDFNYQKLFSHFGYTFYQDAQVGKYYLKINKIDKDAAASVHLESWIYSMQDNSIKSGSSIVSYCIGKGQTHKIVVKNDTYVTLSGYEYSYVMDAKSTMYLELLDSNKKTMKNYVICLDGKQKCCLLLKAGTYYLKRQDTPYGPEMTYSPYIISYHTKAVPKSTNTSYKKAKSVKAGNEYTDVFYTSAKSNKLVRWYKYKLTSKKKIRILVDADPALCENLVLFDSKGKKLEGSLDGKIFTSNKKLTKGTYYIGVTGGNRLTFEKGKFAVKTSMSSSYQKTYVGFVNTIKILK